MLLKVFDKYITELMYAEVYFPAAGAKTACNFNHFRSRRQYISSCTQLSHLVWEELHKTELPAQQRQYMAVKLQEVGKMFLIEDDKVVSHRNLLVYQNNKLVPMSDLDPQACQLLSAFLNIQYSAWLELCNFCESCLSVYRGNYLWKGNEIELLELGDALWVSGRIQPLTPEKTKKMYFKRLFGFFNLPVPDDPCRRLGELALRTLPDSFLSWLRDFYRNYREERDS